MCDSLNRPTQFLSRRDMLLRAANGFGALALTALLENETAAAAPQGAFTPKQTHFEPAAKNIIFLYMDGGPSQVDTFDYKPALEKFHGQDPHSLFKVLATQFDNVGKVLNSPWKFNRYGESGTQVSALFPSIAKHVDDMAFVHSMTSKFPEQTNANYFLHTGLGIQGRPSMGAWVTYGLGSVNQNLPGFVVLNGGLTPPGGLDNFNSGFLPAAYQGSVFHPGKLPVANVTPREPTSKIQQNKLDLLQKLDQSALERSGRVDQLESAIVNYELAARMQMAIPELMDVSKESKSTLDMYGFNHPFKQTQIYGAQCLTARRLVERGVRFIEITCPKVGGDRWDQHNNLKDGHENNARAVDQPIAALIADLKQRGLLASTLIVYAGEFGRTPFAQGTNGRDHNPTGFTVWMAGGGAKGGAHFGATDEFGYHAIQDRVEMYDFHATILHLLGVNHERLTYRFSGRDMRLTDVHGHVIKDVVA